MADSQIILAGDTIGAADAESDTEFLRTCFVTAPGSQVLENPRSPQSIILGRTGSGKTALLKSIKDNNINVIELDLKNLSLNYIANSNVLQNFSELNISLDPFYKLLWQHIFVVELIKKRYGIEGEESLKGFWTKIQMGFSPSKRAAFEYVDKWHSKFWQTTEVRVREIVQKIEETLSAKLGVSFKMLSADAAASLQISQDIKSEIIHKGQEAVIESVQLSQLSHMMNILNEDVFTNDQSPYYIIIDALDEDWVEDSIRYNLIRSLMISINEFRKVENVKLLISLRSDLENSVFKMTNTAGFQRDKFKSSTFKIKWNKERLVELIEKRIDHKFRHRYTKQIVTSSDLFSNEKIDGQKPVDYIISRTLMRPRDGIVFLNECLEKAEGKKRIDRNIVRAAEQIYSDNRIDALIEEWGKLNTGLKYYIDLIRNSTSPRKISFISDELILQTMEKIDNLNINDSICKEFFSDYIDISGFDSGSEEEKAYLSARQRIFSLLYKVGVVGLKPSVTAPRQWSFLDEPFLAPERISKDGTFEVHRAFSSALNVRYDNREHN